MKAQILLAVLALGLLGGGGCGGGKGERPTPADESDTARYTYSSPYYLDEFPCRGPGDVSCELAKEHWLDMDCDEGGYEIRLSTECDCERYLECMVEAVKASCQSADMNLTCNAVSTWVNFGRYR